MKTKNIWNKTKIPKSFQISAEKRAKTASNIAYPKETEVVDSNTLDLSSDALNEFSINRIYASWCFCDIEFSVGGRHGCGNICISHRDDNEHLTQDIDLTEEEFNRVEKFVLTIRSRLNAKKGM
jgi:hypothetical protein